MSSRATWAPDSWRRFPARHQPAYDDPEALATAVAELERLPPLVTSWEVEALKEQLAEAAAGRAFLLQGGDCAEALEDCTSPAITAKLKILLQMSLVLVFGTRLRVVRVGRFAGQYAKPRSCDFEEVAGARLPVYRGDLINRAGATAPERAADPRLLLRAYERSALTLNFVRSLVAGGFADLHHPEYWDLDWVEHSPLASEYRRMVASLGESLRFMETLAGRAVAEMNRVDFFTSHEGLHLQYEQAQTRRVPHRDGWYDLTTHFPWIGLRTSDPDEAHVEFFRGVANPVAVKVGPETTPERLERLLDLLHPRDEPGRLTLVHRFGAERIEDALPPLLEAVRRSGRTVLWCCDPMHGNTRITPSGRKTRRFDEILCELERAFGVHESHGSILGGVHFELTGENVTECTGGARGLSADDLERDYRSTVDPRLNYEQALEMAMHVARRAGRAG
ncbi:MAG: 3-deoxy-7-phosphoheptulonate synthase class II [Thermoanaerobaculia bacterium]|nr:MAG: 3-deoxy-7-phosphoheptulonate synthase class II [Thermoanaerobaculia bacterium]